MTDADYSSADTMELPPKNAEVTQAMAEEEKAAAMRRLVVETAAEAEVGAREDTRQRT